MPIDFASDPAAELDFYSGPDGLGVDGLIGDCPATLRAWLDAAYPDSKVGKRILFS